MIQQITFKNATLLFLLNYGKDTKKPSALYFVNDTGKNFTGNEKRHSS